MIFRISKYLISLAAYGYIVSYQLSAATNEDSNISTIEPIQISNITQELNATAKIDKNSTLESNKTIVYENNTTLKTAVTTAIKSNYRIKQAKERVLQAEHSTREAFADFLPQVSLAATATRKGTKGFDIQEYEQVQGDVTVTYNLFASGMHAATVQRTKITKKEQEDRLRGTLEEEINKVVDAYFSVVYGRLSIEANRNNFEKLLKILEIVKIKREFGAATAGDESSIQASVSNAKTALINTESAYNNARDYYEFLTSTKLELLSPYETDFDVRLAPFDQLFEEIRYKNTDLNLIKTQIKGKQKDVFINKATDWPKLDFSLTNSRRYRNDFNSIPNPATPTQGNNRDSIAELTLSYNFYTGGRTEAKTAKLLSEVSALVYNLEYTTQDTKWNSQKLFNSVQTNSKTLETLTTEINASRRMADAYWEKFRLSSQDLVTLLQAQRQVNSAELEKLRSEKTRLVDYFNLLAKQGKLLEYFGF